VVSAGKGNESTSNRWKDVGLPTLSVIVAFLSVTSTVIFQWQSNRQQILLKEYEITFKVKQELYASFMKKLSDSFFRSHEKDKTALLKSIDDMQGAYYAIEPFLNDPERQQLDKNIQQFMKLCYETYDHVQNTPPPSIGVGDIDSFIMINDRIRESLYPALFRK
jgi:hypothetical protein